MKLVMVSLCTMRTTTTMLQARPRAVEYGRESVCHRTLYRVPTACHGVAAKGLPPRMRSRQRVERPAEGLRAWYGPRWGIAIVDTELGDSWRSRRHSLYYAMFEKK